MRTNITVLTALLALAACSCAPAQQDTVLILLDCSGSMDSNMSGGQKMDVAKTALKFVAENFIRPGTNVGLLTFEGRGVKNDWLYPLGPFDKAQFIKAIERPEPGGGTPLGEYLEKAADALIEFRTKSRGYGEFKLLVVTDGEANDSSLVDEIAPRIKQRGFILDAIGVAMSSSHTLKRIADHYADAQSPETLTRAIQQSFAEVNYNDPVASAEAYAEIAGFDADVAKATLSTLSTYSSLDHRIAEKPRSLGGGPDEAVEEARGDVSWWFIVFLGVILIAASAFILSRANRRRRY